MEDKCFGNSTFPRKMLVWNEDENKAECRMVVGSYKEVLIGRYYSDLWFTEVVHKDIDISRPTYECWLHAKELPEEKLYTKDQIRVILSKVMGDSSPKNNHYLNILLNDILQE
jgi:hypothetical protein